VTGDGPGSGAGRLSMRSSRRSVFVASGTATPYGSAGAGAAASYGCVAFGAATLYGSAGVG
jgi:hypothetical protein